MGGGCSVGGGSVAELAVAIVAPAPECAICFGGTSAGRSDADVVPVGTSNLTGAITSVISPAPECAICFGGAGINTAKADVVPGCAVDLGGGCSVGGGSVAESTDVVVSPAPESSYKTCGARMAVSSVNGFH